MLNQNLNQLSALLSVQTEPESKAPYRNEPLPYKVGQWIDAKDTMGDWLEAQVMEIANGKLLIHYNGWCSRWDEWVDPACDRVSLFRSHTVQSPSAPFLSPFPHLPADTGIPACDADFEEVLEKYCTLQEI